MKETVFRLIVMVEINFDVHSSSQVLTSGKMNSCIFHFHEIQHQEEL